MRTILWVSLWAVAATTVCGQATINNGAMEGPAQDHSNGKGLLVTPAGWTPVNPNTERGDRLTVEASDRPGAGQCLHVHTFGNDAGVYQTIAPLAKGSTYLVTAWVKRLSGTLTLEAYSYNWGPAVMRRLDDRSTGWTKLTVGLTTVDEGAHLYLVASPEADFLIDDVQVRPAALQVGSPELLPFDFGFTWRFRVTLSPLGGVAAPDAVLAVPSAELGVGRDLGVGEFAKVAPVGPTTVVVEIPLQTEESFCVEAREPETGEVLSGSSVIPAPGSPWIVRFPYKDALFASQNYAWALRLNVLTATPAVMASLQASASLVDLKGTLVKEVAGKLEGEALLVPLDGRGLAPGEYRLQLVVRQAGGRQAYKAERPLRVLPPAANEVVVGPAGETLINRQAFFPIGLYWVLADPAGWKPGPARQTAALNELRQAGFNTLHTYAFEHNDANDTDENALAYLDMAQEFGFKVMMGLRRDWCQGAEQNLPAIEQRLRRLKDHPALLCWALWDEPDADLANVPRVQALYDLVNRLDPYHPAMPVFMSAGGRPFRAAADINLFDCYPGAGNAGVLPGVLTRTRAALPDKPIWYAAQAYQQGDKLPSEADMCLYWQYALAADAKAIFWYSYGGDGTAWDSIRVSAEHYAAVKRAVRALADKVGVK